jgi:hypothetical protein
MSDPAAAPPPESDAADAEAPELVDPPATDEPAKNSVEEPARVMRVGTMIRQLLEEVRQTPLDEPSRERLREIYETSIKEIAASVSPDLREELDRLALPFAEGTPTDAELRIAQAQLVGWLEGLFHGIQATLFAQQMAARNQLEDMRRQLPPGQDPALGEVPPGGGTYL